MRLCFIVDARSPIAQNWIRYFIETGHDVSVISTFPCSQDAILGATIIPMPLGVSRLAHSGAISITTLASKSMIATLKSGIRQLVKSVGVSRFDFLRNRLVAIEILRMSPILRRILRQIRPDIVHAMRIPFEGIFAASAVEPGQKLIVSIWGNDLTLHASKSKLVGQLTRKTLARVDALHPDCERDYPLAVKWGFNDAKPYIILPGNGGVHVDIFYPGDPSSELRAELGIQPGAPIVINPRGVRAYVQSDVYYQAAKLVIAEMPQTIFVDIGVKDIRAIERLIATNGLGNNVRMVGCVPFSRMPDYYRLALVSVSPSLHDGTPNTLLEAMACGCYPVAGNIESVREWITTGVNGTLVENSNASALANAILVSLRDPDMRARAAEYNQRLIAANAKYEVVMGKAAAFYEQLIAEPKLS
jgi:glycosyltransferase involved in cell wall biosynthesis